MDECFLTLLSIDLVTREICLPRNVLTWRPVLFVDEINRYLCMNGNIVEVFDTETDQLKCKFDEHSSVGDIIQYIVQQLHETKLPEKEEEPTLE